MPTHGRRGLQYMMWCFKLRGCEHCGRRPRTESEMPGFHIHHYDPTLKVTKHYNMVGDGGMRNLDQRQLFAQLFHCGVLCADCHRDHHRSRNGNGHVQGALFDGTGEAWTVRK